MRVDISRDVTKMSNNKNLCQNHFLSLVACLLRGGSGEDLRRPVINLRSARHKVEPAAATEDFNSNSFHFLF